MIVNNVSRFNILIINFYYNFTGIYTLAIFEDTIVNKDLDKSNISWFSIYMVVHELDKIIIL